MTHEVNMTFASQYEVGKKKNKPMHEMVGKSKSYEI